MYTWLVGNQDNEEEVGGRSRKVDCRLSAQKRERGESSAPVGSWTLQLVHSSSTY